MTKRDIERLMQALLGHKNGKIRTLAATAGVALQALYELEREHGERMYCEARGRYVVITTPSAIYRAKFVHARRARLPRGALALIKMQGAKLGRIVRLITNLDDAFAFRHNPSPL